MRTNGVRYSQVFARILENAGKQQMVTLVTAQVNLGKIFKAVFILPLTYCFRELDRQKMRCSKAEVLAWRKQRSMWQTWGV